MKSYNGCYVGGVKKKLKARGRFSYLTTVPAYNRSVHIPIMTLGRLTKSGKVGIGFLLSTTREQNDRDMKVDSDK